MKKILLILCLVLSACSHQSKNHKADVVELALVPSAFASTISNDLATVLISIQSPAKAGELSVSSNDTGMQTEFESQLRKLGYKLSDTAGSYVNINVFSVGSGYVATCDAWGESFHKYYSVSNGVLETHAPVMKKGGGYE